MACSGDINLTGLLPVFLDLLDIALTIIGLIPAPVPIAGQIALGADASTVVLNMVTDQPIATILSVMAMIPLVGEFAGGLKIIYKFSNILSYFLGSPLIQFAIGIGVLGMIFLLYYFIYYI